MAIGISSESDICSGSFADGTRDITKETYVNARIRQLAAYQIYYENKLQEVKLELERLLKDDVANIDY